MEKGRSNPRIYFSHSHPFSPFYNEDSEILILGSFPSPASRNDGFYYGHKQNRFWKILARIFEEEIPETIEEKKEFLTKHKIALYDAIRELEIVGASDSCIRNAKPTDIASIIKRCPKIKLILCNGKTAYQYYTKNKSENLPANLLPSSSPRNAQFSLEKLIHCWKNEMTKR